MQTEHGSQSHHILVKNEKKKEYKVPWTIKQNKAVILKLL